MALAVYPQVMTREPNDQRRSTNDMANTIKLQETLSPAFRDRIAQQHRVSASPKGIYDGAERFAPRVLGLLFPHFVPFPGADAAALAQELERTRASLEHVLSGLKGFEKTAE